MSALLRPRPNPYLLPEGNVQIAFSGGRTSGLMLHEIMEANGPLPERVVVSFQNTGREMPETLDFVQEVASRWGVQVVWLEYRPDKPKFAVVDHANASRNGEPFEALLRKRKYLPNQQARFCSAELKVLAAKRYLVRLGWKRWTNACGLRADEPSRLNKPQRDRWVMWTPLADAGVGKLDVAKFWKRQPFDLRLPNHNGITMWGNCDGCFLKSEAACARLAVEHPKRAAWWEDMESLVASLTSGDGGTFSSRYSRRELREYIERQGDMSFDATDAALCQKDDGECFG